MECYEGGVLVLMFTLTVLTAGLFGFITGYFFGKDD